MLEIDRAIKFLERPDITFDKDISGGSKQFKISCRSTYFTEPNIFDCLHEVAHLVQFTPVELQEKYVEYDGRIIFDLPNKDVLGYTVCEPETDQISMRELETFYIQYIMECGIFNKSITFEEWLNQYDVPKLFVWMPDFVIFGYDERKKPESLKLILEKANKFINLWDFEKIKNKWFNLKLSVDNTN